MLLVPLNQFAAQQKCLESPTKHKPAGLPVPNPTRSFWIDSPNANPLSKEGSSGELTTDADVCIIGSGITGVSAAYHLSKAIQVEASGELHGASPFSTVILDAREFCQFRSPHKYVFLICNVCRFWSDRLAKRPTLWMTTQSSSVSRKKWRTHET
jgi:hypothetical protein